jgi:hypothetical protein
MEARRNKPSQRVDARFTVDGEIHPKPRRNCSKSEDGRQAAYPTGCVLDCSQQNKRKKTTGLAKAACDVNNT